MSEFDTTLHELMLKTIETDRKTIHRLAEENERLRNENVDYDWQVVELRELVQKLITSHGRMCTQRGTCTGCSFFAWSDDVCSFIKMQDRAHKLGFKVD